MVDPKIFEEKMNKFINGYETLFNLLEEHIDNKCDHCQKLRDEWRKRIGKTPS